MFTSSQISAKVLCRHKTDYIILKFGGLNLEVHQESVSNSVEEKLVQDSQFVKVNNKDSGTTSLA